MSFRGYRGSLDGGVGRMNGGRRAVLTSLEDRLLLCLPQASMGCLQSEV